MLRKYLFSLLLPCVISCKKEQPEPIKDSLFTVLTEKHTGISFENKLDENINLNGFVYEYYYNGAGVATADFNNDGLIDIYFVSNRRANNLYLNQGNLEFKNVTKTSNTKGGFGFPTGVTVVDINQDGLIDIYISKSGRIKNDEHLKNELLINQGANSEGIPVFKEDAKKYGLDLPYHSTQASFFDYDQDGDLDVFLINHGIDVYSDDIIWELMLQKSPKGGERLLKNENGVFVDVTESTGIVNSKLGYGLGCSIGDVNNDGWPDVYVAHDYSEKDHLYLNNQDGTFRESALKSFGHVSNFSMGCDIADINNDGLIDIMSLDMMAQDNYSQKTSMSGMNTRKFQTHIDLGLHHQYMYNALQINNGVDPVSQLPLFSDIAQMSGLSSTDWSWSPLLFDMDNDGLKDVFVSNGIKRDFRNNDFRTYKNKKQEEAYVKGQLDKKAYMNDLLDKMPERKQYNAFMRNKGDFTFEKIGFTQPKTSSNGSAYADFDNDGDVDIVVNNSDDKALIYRNNAENTGNHYLKIKLQGPALNKNAIGAKVILKTKHSIQVVEKYASRGFQSAMFDALHFGLGRETHIDTLHVIWPNGSFQEIYGVAANQTLEVKYKPSANEHVGKPHEQEFLFTDITKEAGIGFLHQENEYDDFGKESLLPHKLSTLGPALAVADINGDGLDDFYVGGAKSQSGIIYQQTTSGTFKRLQNPVFFDDRKHEDVSSVFFDADNDGDQDLYVVSGGNEEVPGSGYYTDRFYENNGKGFFMRLKQAIPKITTSGSKVASGDYDNDGDLDLFVGGRSVPMRYGRPVRSYILENLSKKGNITFVDRTAAMAPELLDYSMVTDAIWVDYDNDSKMDLILASEWGIIDIFKNNTRFFVKITEESFKKQVGWWYSLAADDVDNDGDTDFLAGNLGLNYKYKATEERPFHLYVNDFDDNDSEDIVLAYHEKDQLYPLRGRECSSNQMPFIKEKFKTYDAFGKANLYEVYGQALNNSVHYAATNFASGLFKQSAKHDFRFDPFDNQAQISSINKILVEDFNRDGHKDILLLGNLYGSEVETPRNDASYGHFMIGNGKGNFKAIPANESGLYVKGDVKNAAIINIGKASENIKGILIAKNNDALQLIKFDSG